MDESKSIYTVHWRGFQPVEILQKNNWYYDKELPKNLIHHVMSLRWLREVEDKLTRYSIVEDFIFYHAGDKAKSKFYLGRAADHCASIRLKIIIEVYNEVNGDFEKRDFSRILESEIAKTLDSCLSGKTYKEAHNHGLMVDLSLIESLNKSIPEHYKGRILATVPERVIRQLKAIFSDDGACKEHSISYQEYNLHILHDLRMSLSNKLGQYQDIDRLYEKVDEKYGVVKAESKRLLGFALVSGSYMPLGDSPSQPKGKILKKVYGDSDPEIALYPYSKINGYYFSKSAGFFLYRGPNFSLGFTASWHSGVHKQNDDLAIVLYDKYGSAVILDGGYSGVISDFDQRHENYHSMFMPMRGEWKARNISEGDISGLNIENHGDFLRVVGEHNRVFKHCLNRTIDIGLSSIRLIDSMYPSAKCRHRFIVPEDSEVKLKGDSGCIAVRGFKISPCNNEGLEVNPIDIIYEDAHSSGLAVDFLSEDEFTCEIVLADEKSFES